MARFELVSFTIGALLGAIIMLIVVWIAYYTRVFMFSHCPTMTRICSGTDYFNNPGNAIANGANIKDILYLNQDGELKYRRMPRLINCVPDSGQDVSIRYPQYCSFSDNTNSTEIYKATNFGSNLYKPADGSPGATITTDGNCIPLQSRFTRGEPLLRLDSIAIQD